MPVLLARADCEKCGRVYIDYQRSKSPPCPRCQGPLTVHKPHSWHGRNPTYREPDTVVRPALAAMEYTWIKKASGKAHVMNPVLVDCTMCNREVDLASHTQMKVRLGEVPMTNPCAICAGMWTMLRDRFTDPTQGGYPVTEGELPIWELAGDLAVTMLSGRASLMKAWYNPDDFREWIFFVLRDHLPAMVSARGLGITEPGQRSIQLDQPE